MIGSSPTGDCTYNPSNGAYNVGCMTKLALPLRIAFWSIPSTMFVCLVLSIMVCSAGDRDQYDDDRNTYHSANERHRRKVCTIIMLFYFSKWVLRYLRNLWYTMKMNSFFRLAQVERIIMKERAMSTNPLRVYMAIHLHHHTTLSMYNQKSMVVGIELTWTIIPLG